MRVRLVSVALAGVVVLGTGILAPAWGQPSLAMREKVYEKLSRAQEATEAENWARARELLDDVRKMRDLDANETAQLHNAYGYFYFAQEKYAESVRAYEKVLEQPELPEALETTTLYTVAQLWFHLEDYEKATRTLERWLTRAKDPGPEPLALLGQGYYQLGQPQKVIAPLRRALATAEDRGTPVRENWFALLRAVYHDLADYPKLMETLRELVTRFPRKEYWLHLASTYGELDDSRRQLAAYQMAYEQGFLTNEAELVLLAQLLLQAQVPFLAGEVLTRGMADGIVQGTADNWRLLSQAWTMARETPRAVEALIQAASLSDDGELDARLAQSYASLDDWENAVQAAQVALRKGARDPHELHLLMGMAFFEMQRFGEARVAFAEAQRTPEIRQTATQWINFVEREEERLRELRQSLE